MDSRPPWRVLTYEVYFRIYWNTKTNYLHGKSMAKFKVFSWTIHQVLFGLPISYFWKVFSYQAASYVVISTIFRTAGSLNFYTLIHLWHAWVNSIKMQILFHLSTITIDIFRKCFPAKSDSLTVNYVKFHKCLVV